MHGPVDKLANVSECDDVRRSALDFLPACAVNGTIEENVLAAGRLVAENRPDCQHSVNVALDINPAR